MKRSVCLFVCFLMVGSLMAIEIPASSLKSLASEDFGEREKAQLDLTKWAQQNAGSAVKLLYPLAVEDKDPEIRARCLAILKLLSEDDYLSDGFGYLGVSMFPEAMRMNGGIAPRGVIRITDVMVDSPAAKAGLLRDDLVVEVDGKSWEGIEAINAFQGYIGKKKPRSKIKLKVKRPGIDEFIEIEVTLGRRPVERLEAGMDLDLLNRRARELHFEQWLKKHENKR